MDATVQLNVRMDRNLRDAGNAALESKGLTPSAFVRRVWERLAQRGESLEALVDAVRDFPEAQDHPAIAEDAPILRSSALYESFLADTGISPSGAAEVRPYRDMLEDALSERWRERELDHE